MTSWPRTGRPHSADSGAASSAPQVTSDAAAGPGPEGWVTWREAARIVLAPANLRRTVRVALVVGSILFAINQLDLVVGGKATAAVWIKGAVTFLVPFCVVNIGVLTATRRLR